MNCSFQASGRSSGGKREPGFPTKAKTSTIEVRAEIDASTDKINGKIQRAEQMKVHTMLVIGKRDPAAAGPTPSASVCTAKETLARNQVAK
jgi:threonyl-tRNA synthetase